MDLELDFGSGLWLCQLTSSKCIRLSVGDGNSQFGRFFSDPQTQNAQRHVSRLTLRLRCTSLQITGADTAERVRLRGGYGYMPGYPIARMRADNRMEHIHAGTNEIIKEVIGWPL